MVTASSRNTPKATGIQLQNQESELHSPQISIIVPIYNVEQYLPKCIASILEQPFRDLEIICVDDSSTDASLDILMHKMSRDNRIRLYRQAKNCGASAARNLGMNNARGKYFMFVDADDQLVNESLGALWELGETFGSDAIKGCMLVDEEGTGKLVPHPMNQKYTYQNVDLNSCPDIQHLYQYSTYLFRASVIKRAGIEFDPDLKNFQDPTFLAKLLPECQKICVCETPVYIRKVRPESIITSNWQFENFMSLVNGATRAYSRLRMQKQFGAAEIMALTFSRWWNKLELMPCSLAEDQCMEILRGIENFSRSAEHEIYRFSWLKIDAYHCLKLISEGRLDEGYQRMKTRCRLKGNVPLVVLKIYDICIYSWKKS